MISKTKQIEKQNGQTLPTKTINQKVNWMIIGISKKTKESFIGTAKLKGIRTIPLALETVLNEWIKTEAGKQLWSRMGN